MSILIFDKYTHYKLLLFSKLVILVALISIKSLKESYNDLSNSKNINLNDFNFTNSNEIDDWFDEILQKYDSQIPVIDLLDVLKINSKRTVFSTHVRNRLIIHSISSRLKVLFNIQLSNRNSNIRVLKNIFSTNNRITIMKLDVHKFFDSIPHELLVEEISKNRLLDERDMFLINTYLKSAPGRSTGVHQGTELSSVLAEIFFKNIDKSLRRIDSSLIFVERYVDDILLVFNRNFNDTQIREFYNRIKIELVSSKLMLNDRKTAITSIYMADKYKKVLETHSEKKISPTDKITNYYLSKKGNIHRVLVASTNISYLGYRFNWIRDANKIIFQVDITSSKVYKYKTKAFTIFNEFKKHRASNPKRNDFAYYLLRERLRFLVTTFVLPSQKNDFSSVMIGMKNNYQYIQNHNQINSLLDYIKNNVFYLYKTNMITLIQMQLLMLIIMQNGCTNSFLTMDKKTIQRRINSMSSIKTVFPHGLSDYSHRKYLTSLYLKKVKIE